jgi:hypothetical protein
MARTRNVGALLTFMAAPLAAVGQEDRGLWRLREFPLEADQTRQGSLPMSGSIGRSVGACECDLPITQTQEIITVWRYRGH